MSPCPIYQTQLVKDVLSKMAQLEVISYQLCRRRCRCRSGTISHMCLRFSVGMYRQVLLALVQTQPVPTSRWWNYVGDTKESTWHQAKRSVLSAELATRVPAVQIDVVDMSVRKRKKHMYNHTHDTSDTRRRTQQCCNCIRSKLLSQ